MQTRELAAPPVAAYQWIMAGEEKTGDPVCGSPVAIGMPGMSCNQGVKDLCGP